MPRRLCQAAARRQSAVTESQLSTLENSARLWWGPAQLPDWEDAAKAGIQVQVGRDGDARWRRARVNAAEHAVAGARLRYRPRRPQAGAKGPGIGRGPAFPKRGKPFARLIAVSD